MNEETERVLADLREVLGAKIAEADRIFGVRHKDLSSKEVEQLRALNNEIEAMEAQYQILLEESE